MFCKFSFSVSVISLLSACGGTSTPLTFAEVTAQANSLEAQYLADFNSNNWTPLNTLPTTDTAAYSGSIGFGAPGDTNVSSVADIGLLGEMTVTADFDDSSIIGTANNFYTTTGGTSYSGELDINLFLDRSVNLSTHYGIAGDVIGTLSCCDQSIDFDMDVLADFYRANGEVIIGEMSGTTTFSGSGSAYPTLGLFMVEKD